MSCKAVPMSDSMVCAMCSLTWDVNDYNPPPCKHEEREAMFSRFKERVKGLNIMSVDTLGMGAASSYKEAMDYLDSLKLKNAKNIISEREKTHGDFSSVAAIAQCLKVDMNLQSSWKSLSDTQRESLEMIATKIARILSGDADLREHWDDIAGYATLAAERCSK